MLTNFAAKMRPKYGHWQFITFVGQEKQMFDIVTTKNTVISPIFLVWKFCGKFLKIATP